MITNNIYVYELNGEKMILDVELTAKPIKDDEFWILTDGKRKVGSLCAINVGTFNVTLSSDSSKSVKLSLPLSVLKSDLIDDTVVEEEEDSSSALSARECPARNCTAI